MSNSCLQDWCNHAWMLAAATAGTALPALVAHSSPGLTAGGVALSVVGSVGGVAAGVFTGRMGNVLHDRMKDGVADPRALLRNHHLHRLTAESAKSVLLASQSEMLNRSDEEHLPRLAAAVVSEWDELANTKGFQDAVLGLSRDDLKAWLGAGLGDEASSNPPRALTPDAWEIMLRAVGRKHGCTLSDRALSTVATRLHEQFPETVREMLKQGGPALNGMLLLLLGDIHSAVCRTLDEKLDKLAASGDQLSQLSSLLGILQRAATILSQRLEDIPNRAFLITQFEQQSAWLIAALQQLGEENKLGHATSHNKLDQVHSLLRELATRRYLNDIGEPLSDHKPINLPLASIGPLFKGREAFLDDLRDKLGVSNGRATAIVSRQAIHGLGGVGKTRAAIEYAWRHADEYSALLFVSGPSTSELRANLANLLVVLGTTARETSVDQQLAEVLRWLDAHPGWLLIVDGVDTEESACEVERLLARLRAGHVLITSRIANWSTAVEPLGLDVLEPADAVVFLLERTPHRRQQPADEDDAAAIAGELGGLALALEQAGAYIDKLRLSFAEYLQRWEAKQPEVLRWHDPRLMQYPVSVAVTWETTFAQLTEPEQRLLEVLAWLAPEPIPLFLLDAAPLAEIIPDPHEARAGLEGYSLARRIDASGDAVLVHRLVQEVTLGRIPAADRTATLKIALDAVNAVAPYDADDVRTWAVWTPLAAHAEAVGRSADEAGIAEPAARLLNDLGMYWQARGQFGAAEPLYRRALAIDERSYGPDHPDVARDLNNLAVLLRATNRLAEADPLYRRALAIGERSYGPDHPTVARALSNLASLLQDTNRLDEAEPLYRRALAIGERSYGPDHPNVATALNNLAGLLLATNRLAEAEPLYRRALAIDERSYGPDHPDVARRLNNLASLLQDTNRLAEAEPLYRRALAIGERSHGPGPPRGRPPPQQPGVTAARHQPVG